MALENAPITSAPKEKIPFLVREAIGRVSVDEYLKLRYRPGRGVSNDEGKQILAGVGVVQKQAEKMGKTYSLEDPIKFSADPRVIASRLILQGVPLPVYLAVRARKSEAVITYNRKHRDYYEVMGDPRLEKLINEFDRQVKDLNLTMAVVNAAGIKLNE